MISYEINIICDQCKKECFTSEPMPKPSVKTALHEAQKEGWEWERLSGKRVRALCRTCASKETQ